MADNKVTKSEEEYFAKEDAEKLKRLRKELDEERERQKNEQLKKAHWMKCPKCGHDLEEKPFKGIAIDQCKECQGVWLDNGELEMLAGRESTFLKSLVDTFKAPKRK